VRVLLRVDGGHDVGMGHVVRSHALGAALRKRGADVEFLTNLRDSATWLQARDARVERAGSTPGSQADADNLLKTARLTRADVLVTDGYVFREDYLGRVAEGGLPLASIDDLAAWHFPSQIVINGTLGAKNCTYSRSPQTRLLLGPEYLLLREAFRPRAEPPAGPLALFACFGGSDPDDYTAVTIRAWETLRPRPFLDLVVGPAYAHFDRLRARREDDLRLHRDLEAPELAAVMGRAHLAVASAGMIGCELTAIGVPALLAVLSDDQRANASTLAGHGSARVVHPFTADRLQPALEALLRDEPARRDMAATARRVIDGGGCARVADAIVALAGGTPS
jgi:UDP-2,4-diacetamido-2,4,6-trideoxy-beta-L-altropyranose hydrolase